MVVMITPVAFTNIGYKTYIIFAVINAFICPVVYFFYPETDAIFNKTKGWFNVVSTAKHEPLRYGKDGELLIEYEEDEERTMRAGNRRSAAGHNVDKPRTANIENRDTDTATASSSSMDEKRAEV
jgi:hypothetical protein